MRAVARVGEGRSPVYGRGPYEASRVDSFLDASLVFARDAQTYLLSLSDGSVSAEIHARAQDALATYLAGINRTLLPQRRFLVATDSRWPTSVRRRARAVLQRAAGGRRSNERALPSLLEKMKKDVAYTLAFAHSMVLCADLAFAPDVEPYLQKIDRAAS